MKRIPPFSPFLLLILVLLLNACRERPIEPRVLPTSVFEQKLRQMQDKYGIPGAVAAVFSADSILNVGASGVRRLGSPAPVTINDPFMLGSCAKGILATAAARLIERDLIRWETPLLTIFPELATTALPAYQRATLQDLLSHRAGIQPFESPESFAQLPAFNGSPAEQNRAFVAYLLQQPPVAPEKDGYRYSNAGYTAAAAMLERVTGKDWQQILRDEVFTPLSIRGSSGVLSLTNPDAVFGHALERGRLVVKNEPLIPPLIGPAGDLNMSIRDYASFLKAQLAGLRGRNNLLTAASYQKIHFANRGVADYNLGWLTTDWNGQLVSVHNGGAGTFLCYNFIFPEQNVGMAIIVNLGDADGSDRADDAILWLAKQYYKALR